MFKKEYIYDFVNQIYKGNGKITPAVSIFIKRLESSNNADMAKEISNIRDNNTTITKTSFKRINNSKRFSFYSKEIRKRTSLVVSGYKNNLLNSLLIYGKPGTGKTHFATELAKELKVSLIKINVQDIMDYRYGQSMKNLSNAFIKNKDTRQVIFFDEVDSLFSKRGQGNDLFESRRILTTMLQLLDMQREALVIFSTNLIKTIDKAIIRRFDMRISFNTSTDQKFKFLINTLEEVEINLNEKESIQISEWLLGQDFTLADIKLLAKRIAILKKMNCKFKEIIIELNDYMQDEIELSRTIEMKVK